MAGKKAGGGRGDRGSVIIVRREEGEEAGHHGGAWKVAYADFVTAMMAFFLLMWLLNATTEEQRTGLADYFAPTNLFGRSVSGSGQPFGGKTPNDPGTSVSTTGSPQIITGQNQPQQDVDSDDTEVVATPLTHAPDNQDDPSDPGAGQGGSRNPNSAAPMGPDRQPLIKGGDYAAARLTPAKGPIDPDAPDAERRDSGPGNAAGAMMSGLDAANATATSAASAAVAAAGARQDAQTERRALEQAGQQIMEAIKRDPSLQDATGQFQVDVVPQGLRIQVMDADRRPMFALGSAAPTDRVRALMQKVVPTLNSLSNEVSISGHTDALTYRGQDRDNWDLSADRANATRRILVQAGLSPDRIRNVTGNADRDLLMPNDPDNPANRRITIVVLRHATPVKTASAKP